MEERVHDKGGLLGLEYESKLLLGDENEQKVA